MKTNQFQIVIEEIARVALEKDYRHVIGHELDLSDEEMDTIYEYLTNLLSEDLENA